MTETALNIVSFLFLGFFLGMRHATDADHVVAIATIVSREHSMAGSAVIGKTLKSEILREEALELALGGFLPFTERGEAPKEEKRSLFRELGLPYVTDPAITRHLAEFMSGATDHAPNGVDAILFNGGFFVLSHEVGRYLDGDHSTWEQEPLRRLTGEGQLASFRHRGFWQAMDTLRDRHKLEELWETGHAPWRVWE